jgi:hypothetical protein
MKSFLYLLLITSLISCSKSVTINKTLPAEFVFHSGEKAILQNGFDAEALDLGSAEEKKLKVYTSGIAALLKQMEYELSEKEGMQVIVLDSGRFQDTSSETFATKMESACASSSADFYFVLDKYELDFDQTDVEKDDDGDKVASYDLVASANFDLYSCDIGQKIKSFEQSARVFYEDRAVLSGLLAKGPSLKKAEEEAVVISKDIAILLSERFRPVNIEVSLYYYATKSMKEAALLIERKNYESAIPLLLELAKNNDSAVAGEAANNLYVVYEILGDDSQSQYWYDQAVSLNQLHILNTRGH